MTHPESGPQIAVAVVCFVAAIAFSVFVSSDWAGNASALELAFGSGQLRVLSVVVAGLAVLGVVGLAILGAADEGCGAFLGILIGFGIVMAIVLGLLAGVPFGSLVLVLGAPFFGMALLRMGWWAVQVRPRLERRSEVDVLLEDLETRRRRLARVGLEGRQKALLTQADGAVHEALAELRDLSQASAIRARTLELAGQGSRGRAQERRELQRLRGDLEARLDKVLVELERDLG